MNDTFIENYKNLLYEEYKDVNKDNAIGKYINLSLIQNKSKDKFTKDYADFNNKKLEPDDVAELREIFDDMKTSLVKKLTDEKTDEKTDGKSSKRRKSSKKSKRRQSSKRKRQSSKRKSF